MSKQRIYSLVLMAFGLIIFTYIVVRCFTVPPFIDEVLNYHWYVRTGEIFPFYAHSDANNHFISTGLNFVSYRLFGRDFLFMRLIEASSFILYYSYLMKLRQFLKSQLLGVLMVISLSSSLLMLSFFSLAREYGIALALMAGGIYFLLRFINGKRKKDFIFVLIMTLLGIWVNFVLLPVIVLMLVVAGFYIYRNEARTFFMDKRVLLMAAVYLSLFAVAVVYVFHLKSIGGLWIGGKTGFMQDVVFNMTYQLLGPKGIWVLTSGGIIILISFLLSFKNINWNSNTFAVGFIFLGTIFGTIGLHLLFGVNYPRNRAAIHFVLIGIIFLFFFFDLFIPKLKMVMLFLPLVFLIHLGLNFNLSYALTWREYTLSEDIYDELVTEQNKTDELCTISSPYGFGVVYDYYSYLKEDGTNTTQWIDFPSSVADLLIVDRSYDLVNDNGFDTLAFDPVSEIAIFKRKNKVVWNLLEKRIYQKVHSNQDSIELASYDFQKSGDEISKIEVNASFKTEDFVKFSGISIVLEDENGTIQGREVFVLNQAYDSFLNFQEVHFAYYFPELLDQSYAVKVILINPRNYLWGSSEIEISTWITKNP